MLGGFGLDIEEVLLGVKWPTERLLGDMIDPEEVRLPIGCAYCAP
jgi:hypothetical protein